MKPAIYALGVTGSLIYAGITVGIAVDSALCRVPVYRVPRACLLDRLLGPAEEFEFVGATTPIKPPTTR